MNVIERQELERDISTLELNIRDLGEDKKETIESRDSNKWWSKFWLSTGVIVSAFNYLLTYKADYARALIAGNVDLNDLKIGNMPVDFHTYFGLQGALIILPAPIILSLFYKSMERLDKIQLEFLKEVITERKIELGSMYAQLNENENNNTLSLNLKKEDNR